MKRYLVGYFAGVVAMTVCFVIAEVLSGAMVWLAGIAATVIICGLGSYIYNKVEA